MCIEAIQNLNKSENRRVTFAQEAQRRYEALPDKVVRLDIAVLAATNSGNPNLAIASVSSEAAEKAANDSPFDTSIPSARVALGHEQEDYRRVLAESRRLVNSFPEMLRDRLDFLKASFAAGKMLELRDALEFVGRQYTVFDDHPGPATPRELEKTVELFSNSVMRTLENDVEYFELKHGKKPRVGVFFLSSTQALGHAILDPFHFLALNRDKFDRIYFIGPPKSSYSPAPRACLQIVEQYGDYIETHSDILMNLSWLSLGEFKVGSFTFAVDNYWSLLRSVVHRSNDTNHTFNHNDWHMRLPAYYTSVGEAFCRQHKIDLKRPLVTLHARDDKYHGIARQSFRNSSIEIYRDAIAHLIESGFQVVRLGDTKMPSLYIPSEHYFELPFLDGYSHELDAFFISQSKFMIGCQSGPCAFARVLGVPMLTINAVLHYTLLPTPMEMACFKRYYRGQGPERRELSVLDALEERVDQFDNSYHFLSAEVSVESASPDEVLAATKDMIAWVKKPKLAMTKLQKEFRDRCKKHTKLLAKDRDNLRTPVADYVGISLPGYRVSDGVEMLRASQGRPNT